MIDGEPVRRHHSGDGHAPHPAVEPDRRRRRHQSMGPSSSSLARSRDSLGGGIGSFEDFYQEQWPEAVRVAHLLSGVDAVAEDLAQEAFTRLRTKWATIRNPGGYLRASLVNAARSWSRSTQREQARLLRSVTAGRSEEELHVSELLDAVAALPYRQKAVLVLRYYCDLSELQIAEILDCRPGTVKSLASRALEQLRKDLEE